MKLLLDEMYPPDIAELLRRAGHDVVSVHERRALRSQPDATVFAVAQAESRVVLTNNVPDYVGIVRASAGAPHHGLIFTSDRSLRRTRDDIGVYVELLDALMSSNPGDDALADRTLWLRKPT